MDSPDDLDTDASPNDSCLRKIKARVEERLRSMDRIDLENLEQKEARRLLHDLQMELRLQQEDLGRALQGCPARRKAGEVSGKLQETNLRLTNEKHFLSAVMEALPTCVAITDREGGLILSNKACERIWGGAMPETPAIKNYSSFKAFWGDTDIPVAPEEWAAALAVREGKTTLNQMMRIRRFDGSEIYILNSASPVYGREGNVVGSAVTTEDVSELKRIEKALYESEQRLRLLIDQAPVALAMLDRELCYLSASRRWVQDSGMEDRELTGLSVYDVHKVPERWREANRRGLAGEVVEAEEDLYRRFDGSLRWIRWKIHPWFGATGEVGGIVVFTEDITERKQFEEQLRLLNEELERRVASRTLELQETHAKYLHAEKLSAIGRLAASIAHEFNNPIQGILTVLQGLSGAVTVPEDREMLHLAIGECQRLAKLVKNLRELNRPSPGQKAWLDVHEAIHALLLLCKSDFRKKRLDVELELAEGLPRIHAVPDQIKQVFLNLLTNAADACAPGGRITIRSRQEQQSIAVAITDNGTGIDPEKKDLIFQPFYSTKLAGKGTGLGLSVCCGIINDHQGEMKVESEPGEGSTFTVLLPIDSK